MFAFLVAAEVVVEKVNLTFLRLNEELVKRRGIYIAKTGIACH